MTDLVVAAEADLAFNYALLAPDVAVDLRHQAARLRGLMVRSTVDMIEIGRDLIAIKAQLGHGQFTDWVEREIGVTVRTVQGYMAIAKLNGKNETISLLPPSTARMLAAKSVAPEIVQQVITRANSGDIVPEATVKGMIEEDRQAKWIAKREAKVAARRGGRKAKNRQADRVAYLAERERENQGNRAKAQSIIDRFTQDDIKFLADALTWDVFDQFRSLIEEGGAT